MKKIIFGLFALSMLSIVGCKKDDKKSCDLNQDNLQGSYKITGMTYKADASTAAIDVYALMDACEKDDVITLGANFAASVADQGTQCSPTSADTGNWLFNATDSRLTITFPTWNTMATISSFSCSGMTLTENGTDPGEVTTYTFTKQ